MYAIRSYYGFQSQGTMGGLALIKRALLEEDLLQRIMEKAAPAT